MCNIRKLTAAMLMFSSVSAFAVDDVTYFSDTLQKNDLISAIYRVEIDPISSHANLIPLPTDLVPADGIVPYDHIDALAASPDGKILWLINSREDVVSELIKYEVDSATLMSVGVIEWPIADEKGDIDQATVAPDGTLYVTKKVVHHLYTIDTSNAKATLVGDVNGALTNGGDIAFDQFGSLYLLNQTSLYDLTLPGSPPAPVNAVEIGGVDEGYTGLAFRVGGVGNLIGSNKGNNSFNELSVVDGSLIVSYPMYLNGGLFEHNLGGDMTTGPLVMCSKTIGYWKNHSWLGASVTINDMSDEFAITEVIGRFGTKAEGDKPYDGMLWRAKGKTYSMLYAQLIAAKLNTSNSYTVDLLNTAEAFLDGKGFDDPVSKADRAMYSKLVEAVTAFNEDNHCDSE
ncbi:hypothetical protein HR45_03115 [Shewanella mangrovi]|uniref:Uncharacterized protein n=2 Tax=Shewanella mangrovi TaxID=1515746 RepID=A0A094JGW3_9GAMM|nr:hypothetical protein HR45_03115 [Shewanella mangrovi]